jgi:hypothetical protein
MSTAETKSQPKVASKNIRLPTVVVIEVHSQNRAFIHFKSANVSSSSRPAPNPHHPAAEGREHVEIVFAAIILHQTS